MTKVDDWILARAYIEVAQSHVRNPENQSPTIEQALEYIEGLSNPLKEEVFCHFVSEVREIVGGVSQEVGPTLNVHTFFGSEQNLLRILELLPPQAARGGVERI